MYSGSLCYFLSKLNFTSIHYILNLVVYFRHEGLVTRSHSHLSYATVSWLDTTSAAIRCGFFRIADFFVKRGGFLKNLCCGSTGYDVLCKSSGTNSHPTKKWSNVTLTSLNFNFESSETFPSDQLPMPSRAKHYSNFKAFPQFWKKKNTTFCNAVIVAMP